MPVCSAPLTATSDTLPFPSTPPNPNQTLNPQQISHQHTHSAYFLFPITATPADPKPVLVSASLSGAGAKVLPLDVTNATAILHLYALGKLVVITQVCLRHCRRTSQLTPHTSHTRRTTC